MANKMNLSLAVLHEKISSSGPFIPYGGQQLKADTMMLYAEKDRGILLLDTRAKMFRSHLTVHRMIESTQKMTKANLILDKLYNSKTCASYLLGPKIIATNDGLFLNLNRDNRNSRALINLVYLLELDLDEQRVARVVLQAPGHMRVTVFLPTRFKRHELQQIRDDLGRLLGRFLVATGDCLHEPALPGFVGRNLS